MSLNWRKVKLSDVATFVNGRAYKSSELLEEGKYRLLRVGNLFTNNKWYYSDLDLKDDKYCSKGDLIYAWSATFGPHIWKEEKVIYHYHIWKIVTDSEAIDKLFLYYLLKDDTKNIKSIYGTGATMIHITKSAIESRNVKIPILTIQCKIASILLAYDNLIENNTRRIEILEEMAQRIYKEWFVDFKYPGHENDKLVDSKLGMIPEGWEVKTLNDFGKVITGSTPSKKISEFYGKDVPFIKTPDMHNDIFCIKTGEYLSELGSNSHLKKILPKNTICVSCIGTAGVVSITTRNSHTNQQINSIVLDNQMVREFLYFSLLNLKKTIEKYGATGATMVNLSKGKFEALKIACANTEVITEFNQICMPIFSKILNLQYSNQKLKETRDYLLPKLISGKVDVSDLDIDTSILDD